MCAFAHVLALPSRQKVIFILMPFIAFGVPLISFQKLMYTFLLLNSNYCLCGYTSIKLLSPAYSQTERPKSHSITHISRETVFLDTEVQQRCVESGNI